MTVETDTMTIDPKAFFSSFQPLPLYEEEPEVIFPKRPAKTDPLPLRYLNDEPPTQTNWVIEGILPEGGCNVLGAEPKVGKSWVSFDLALCLATGQNFLGRYRVPKTGPTLIYSPEGGWNARSQRLWGLCWGRDLDPRVVLQQIPFINGRVDLASEESAGALAETIARVNPRLLIIDPLITAHVGTDENASSEMQRVLDKLRDISIQHPSMAVLVAHHLGKGSKGQSAMYGLRGSSALPAWADGLITLRQATQDASSQRRMDIIHRDAPSPPPTAYTLHVGVGQIDGLCQFRLDQDDVQHKSDATLADVVLDKITAQPEVYNVTTLAMELGRNKGSISKIVNNLINRAVAYRLPPEGLLGPCVEK